MTKLTISLLFSILISCLLTSCDSGGGDSGNTITRAQIDPQLKADLDIFLAEAAARNITLNQARLNNLNIIFDDLPEDTLGLCTVRSDGSNLVQISNRLKGADSSFTTIHELGHCILHMEHRDVNLSLMNTRSSDAILRLLPRKQVFDEFFTPRFFEAF